MVLLWWFNTTTTDDEDDVVVVVLLGVVNGERMLKSCSLGDEPEQNKI